ncbi:MAG: hypothetical protein ACYC7D_05535 [Nitrososphaerales archaeon]
MSSSLSTFRSSRRNLGGGWSMSGSSKPGESGAKNLDDAMKRVYGAG